MCGASISWDQSQTHLEIFTFWLRLIICSKWVEAVASKTNDNNVAVKFLKENIFSRFGAPHAIISGNGTHFCNRFFEALTRRYSITHKLSTLYHSQMSGQVKVSNRGIKQILNKIVNLNRKDWSLKLVDTFWAYRTAFKINLGTISARLWESMPPTCEIRAQSHVGH